MNRLQKASGARGMPVFPVGNEQQVVSVIQQIAEPGDIVICLGAGNSTDLAHALPELLGGEPKRAGVA